MNIPHRGKVTTPTALMNPDSAMLANRANEVKPELGVGECPDWVTGRANEIWKELTDRLSPLGLLSTLDTNAFGKYCILQEQYERLAKDIQENGVGYVTHASNGGDERRYIRPEFTAWMDISKQLMQAEAKFGLTPSDRAVMGKSNGKTDGAHGNSSRVKELLKKHAV